MLSISKQELTDLLSELRVGKNMLYTQNYGLAAERVERAIKRAERLINEQS